MSRCSCGGELRHSTARLEQSDPRYSGRDPRYQGMSKAELPLTECLKDTVARFLPYWHEAIAPSILSGKKVIIAAHGNSLRALVKYLDGISDKDIVGLNIPTGVPLVYELDCPAQAGQALLPGRSRGGSQGSGGRGCPGEGQVAGPRQRSGGRIVENAIQLPAWGPRQLRTGCR